MLGRASVVGVLVLACVGGVASAATLTVALGTSGPQPKSMTVGWGDTVVFTNGDSVPHSISSSKHPELTSPSIPPAGTFSHVFDGKAGTYSYRQLGARPRDAVSGSVVLQVTGNVTLRTSRPMVIFGDRIVLSGHSTLLASPVRIERDEAGGGHAFSPYLTLQLQPDGTFRTTFRPRIGVRYRATAALEQLKSAQVNVKVAPRLTIAASPRSTATGHAVRIVGRVSPVGAVGSLALERFDSSKRHWVSIATRRPAGHVATFEWHALQGRTRLRLTAGKRAVADGYVPSSTRQVLVTGVGAAPGSTSSHKTKKKKHR